MVLHLSTPLWRENFINCIHRKPLADEDKCLILMDLLKDKAEKYKSQRASWFGYRMVIKQLERDFGGKMRDFFRCTESLEAFPYIRTGDTNLLGELLVLLEETEFSVSHMPGNHSFDDPHIYRMAISLFPRTMKEQFEEYMDREKYGIDERPTSQLVVWLEKKYTFWQRAGPFVRKERPVETARMGADQGGRDHPEDDEQSTFLASDNTKQAPRCALCSVRHYFQECKKFLAGSPDDRMKIARQFRTCLRCLRTGHFSRNCKETDIKCGTCGEAHHSLLHGVIQGLNGAYLAEEMEQIPGEQFFTIVDEPSVAVDSNSSMAAKGLSSLRFAAVNVMNTTTGKNKTINALLDDGATFVCISEKLANELQCHGVFVNMAVLGFNGELTNEKSVLQTEIMISDAHNSFHQNVEAKVFRKPVGNLKAVDWNLRKAKYPHIASIDFSPVKEGQEVHMVIGTKYAKFLSALVGDIEGPEGTPIARLTRFGWTAVGPLGTTHHVDTMACQVESLFLAREKLDLLERTLLSEGNVDDISQCVLQQRALQSEHTDLAGARPMFKKKEEVGESQDPTMVFGTWERLLSFLRVLGRWINKPMTRGRSL